MRGKIRMFGGGKERKDKEKRGCRGERIPVGERESTSPRINILIGGMSGRTTRHSTIM